MSDTADPFVWVTDGGTTRHLQFCCHFFHRDHTSATGMEYKASRPRLAEPAEMAKRGPYNECQTVLRYSEGMTAGDMMELVHKRFSWGE